MNLEDVELPAALRTKLFNEGYETVEELKKASLIDLSKGLQLSKQDISKVLEITRGGVPVRQGKNMLEFISEDDDKGIALSSKNLESLFENGIPVRRLTELCGESGTGKTQICMQLAVNVQKPKEQGGLDGECIYIDTEGSFLSHRLIKMINGHDALAYLNKIHLFRVYNHTELIALIRQLPDILSQKFQNKVKLIIIDSIAYHFRMNAMDSRRRDIFLPNLAHLLIRVATNHTLAVVVTNHVTENITDGTWIPALGTAWGNWCAFRLFLFRRRQFRFGYLYKCIEDDDSIVPVQFCIKSYGVTDPGQEEMLQNNNELDSDEITERLENSLGAIKIVKSDDIWSQNLLANDEQEDDNVQLDESPPSPSSSNNNKNGTITTSQSTPPSDTSSSSSSVNKNSAITTNGSTSKSSTKQNHKALNGLNGNAESSKSPDNGILSSEQPQAEEAPPSNNTMAISEKKPNESHSSVERPSRNKGKRKLVDYTELDSEEQQVATETSMISESLNVPDKQQEQASIDKRKTKKKKTTKKDKIPEESPEMTNIPIDTDPVPTTDRKRKAQNKPLPPPAKTRRRKKPLPKEDSSDWSDSEIEDDLEFLAHFEEPF